MQAKKNMTMKSIYVAAALLAFTGSASAFEQSTVQPQGQSQGSTGGSTVEVKPAGDGLGVELNVQDVGAGDAGTEIQIPGLGTIGVLPKLDFGLELLYGANDKSATDDSAGATEGELTVRGAVKKSF